MKLFLSSIFLILFNHVGFSQSFIDTLTINSLYVPNAATFDHDNVNDGWRVESMVEWDEYQVLIFNKWGECVWMSNDVEEWWIGDHRINGTHYSRDGMYMYQVSARKGFNYVEKSGTIYIIR
jgi:hypothetical protein